MVVGTGEIIEVPIQQPTNKEVCKVQVLTGLIVVIMVVARIGYLEWLKHTTKRPAPFGRVLLMPLVNHPLNS